MASRTLTGSTVLEGVTEESVESPTERLVEKLAGLEVVEIELRVLRTFFVAPSSWMADKLLKILSIIVVGFSVVEVGTTTSSGTSFKIAEAGVEATAFVLELCASLFVIGIEEMEFMIVSMMLEFFSGVLTVIDFTV